MNRSVPRNKQHIEVNDPKVNRKTNCLDSISLGLTNHGRGSIVHLSRRPIVDSLSSNNTRPG